MKLTLANIKELKRNSDSPLLKRVCNYVIDRWSDYNDKKGIFADVLHYGCQSGIVGELIYYHDTVRFYKQYRQEINSLPYDLMNGTAKPIRRKDRTAEKRQPIPSGLAGTAPHRRVVLVAVSRRVLGCGARQRGALVYNKLTPNCHLT